MSTQFKLTDRFVRTAKRPGLYNDGNCLYLQVSPGGTKSFILRKRISGKLRKFGLGGYPTVSLKNARTRAFEVQQELLSPGVIDSIARGSSIKQALIEEQPNAPPTFWEFSQNWMDDNLGYLSNPKSRQQWYSTIRDYCVPIHDMPISDIQVTDVLKCIRPIWERIPETAKRLQQRLERILGAATVLGLRDGVNPAQLKHNLELMLPKRTKMVKHHDALPYIDLPSYFERLEKVGSISGLALQLIVLTACRSGEARNARWEEFDWDKKVWVIPSSRTKSRKEHVVPLSSAAIAVLERALQFKASDYVFPGQSNFGISDTAVRNLAKRLSSNRNITVHGFRSCFRDWIANETSYPRELAEEQLAHSLSAVEAAYRRGAAVKRRLSMMEGWASFVQGDE